MTTQDLAGRIAVVAGATRGAGRAIAIELGARGATVYVTGRSTREGRSVMNRPETIEGTAEKVTAAGGKGISVRCDHSKPYEVAGLAERIQAEVGVVDILVNDIWGGDPLVDWEKKLWEHPLDDTLAVIRNGVETHVITSHHLLPLVLRSDAGLVVEVGDGKADVAYRGNIAYDIVKSAVVRLAESLNAELSGTRAMAVSVTPGFLRSEAMLELAGVTEQNWREASDFGGGFFAYSETPHLLARGLAAMAADPRRARFAGTCLGSWDLMHEYEVVDLDGSSPDWGRVDARARQSTLTDGFPEVGTR
ncbi:MAG: SDR family NAD(P)-dependent oxidoreductase [Actinobacteria bacterium]|nr:SDR family NAD(P)-dependent oxidoreductase [Actinomycetota bacterium]